MDIDFFEHKLQIATANDVNTNGSFGYAVDVDGDYAIVTKRGHQENYNSAYIFKKTGNNWAMHQDISGQPIGYDNFGLDAKIINELVFISCRTYYSDSSQRPSNEKGGIHVYKLNSISGYFEPYNPSNLDPTDKTKYGYDNAGHYDGDWGPYNFPAGPDARSNVIVPGPNYDGTNPEDFYFNAIPENPNSEFSFFFDVYYENNVYTLIVGHPGTYKFLIFKHDTTDSTKGWLRWEYNLGYPNSQKTGYDDVAIYGDYVFLSYTDPESKKGKVYIYKFDDTQPIFSNKWQRQTPDLVPLTRNENERFGTSLSAFEDYLIVGTQNDRALIYKKDSNGEWLNTSEKVLTAITEEVNSKFGVEVAIGKINPEFYAVVGARQKNVNGQINEGVFYLYKLIEGEWVQRNDDTDGEFIEASGDNPSSTFSASINIRNNQIVVGAGGHQNNTTADNSSTTYSGAAYIFNLEDNTPSTYNVGLNDIINNFLVTTSIVNFSNVDFFFQETINIKNFETSELNTLFADLSNNELTKNVKNYIAFKIIKIKPSLTELVTLSLYDSNDTGNASFDIEDIVAVAKEVIFDPSNNESINTGVIIPNDESKSLYRELKTLALRKIRTNVDENTFENAIKNISTTDNDSNIQAYLENIDTNLALNLSGMDLSGVDLTGIDLSGAILEGTDLSGANLTGANLTGADLSGSVLDNVNFNNTISKNIKNIDTSTGVTTQYPYNFQIFNNQMRTLTENLNKASISTQETKMGPFKQGQTIIVNGVKIILGASVSDAVLVDSDPNSDGDSFTFIEKNNKIKNWGHKNKGGNIPSDISNVKIISSNENSTAILTTNGYVYAWGNENFGGNITQDLSGITELFVNEKAYCALKNDGKIFCWGDSSTGGTTPSNIENVVNIYSNKNAFTALISDGTIHSWGSINGITPTTNNFIDVFSTIDCFCGLKGDGTIESWGSSNNSLNTTPIDISNVSMIFSNDNAFVALTSNGYLYNWGGSSYGGTTNLSALDNIDKVYNNNHAFACLDKNNNLFCWGDSNKGGTTPTDSKHIINIFATQDAFTGLKTDKSMVCWGNTNNGGTTPTNEIIEKNEQTIFINKTGCAFYKTDKTVVTFGNLDSDYIPQVIKKQVHSLRNVKQLFANQFAFCALMEDGTVYSWGSNNYGGDNTDSSALKDIVDIYPVNKGFVAIDSTNKIFSWGDSYLQETPPGNGEKILQITRNNYSIAVLTETNTLKGWGYSHSVYGSEIPNVKKLFTSWTSWAAIKNDNSCIVWGYNSYSDERYLSDSNKGVRHASSSTVDETLLNSDISNVYLNYEVACALKIDGSVIGWGRDIYGGNLHHTSYGPRGGNSSTVNPSLLTSNVKDIVIQMGDYKGFIAIKNDKSLVVWGNNSYLNPHHTSYGVRKPTFYNDSAIYPEEITGNIEKVFTHRYCVVAIKTDGSVITWGNNSHGGNICHSSSGVRGFSSSTVDPSVLSSGVLDIVYNQYAVVALKENNVPYVWGHNGSYGGNIWHTSYGVRDNLSDKVNPSTLQFGLKKIVTGEFTFCVLKEDGNIAAWGSNNHGGNIHDVNYGINANGGDINKISTIGVKDIFSSYYGFVAVLNDNSILTWGGQNITDGNYNITSVNHLLHNIDYNSKRFKNNTQESGGDLTKYILHIHDVPSIKNDSTTTVTNNISNIEKVYSTDKAFAAINTNGELKIWGNTNFGGSHNNLADKKRVVDIMSTKGAFIGINQDGTHFIWGNNNFGAFGGPTESFKFENRVQDLYSYCQSYRKSNLFALYGINKDTRKFIEESFTDTNSAHIALSNNGTVSTWGNETFGSSSANTQTTIDNLTNVKDISTGNDTVVALKSDGTLTAWNDDDITLGDNSNFKKVVTGISGNIIGLKADGTVKYYNPDLGNWTLGSNIDTNYLTDLSGITDIFAFDKSFAALDDKGALTVWGDLGDGPNLLTNISSKASQLTSGVKTVTANSNVLIALKYDGTVVTVGNANNGGDISNTEDQYKLYGGTADDIEEVFLNDKFAVALKCDRTCIYWGDISRNTDLFNSDISKFKNIKTVAYSKDVMVGLTFDGKIYTLGEKSKGGEYPHQLEKNVEKVISASLNGFLAVTNDNKIYSWGEDSNYVNNIENTANNIAQTSGGSTSSSSSGTTSGGSTSGGSTSGGSTSSSSGGTTSSSSGGTSSGGTSSGGTSSGGGYNY